MSCERFGESAPPTPGAILPRHTPKKLVGAAAKERERTPRASKPLRSLDIGCFPPRPNPVPKPSSEREEVLLMLRSGKFKLERFEQLNAPYGKYSKRLDDSTHKERTQRRAPIRNDSFCSSTRHRLGCSISRLSSLFFAPKSGEQVKHFSRRCWKCI